MLQATADEPERNFPVPQEIRFVHIDPETGCRIDASDTRAGITVAVKKGQTLCGETVQ
jgi:membrane carboxypeptidase/penicillin-binding protein